MSSVVDKSIHANQTFFQAEVKLQKSRATAVIDDYTKIRFVKTKDQVVDGKPSPAKLPGSDMVTEGKQGSQS